MKIFHGWRVASAGAGLQFMQAGLNHQSFGAYIAVLAAEQGWSKTALSGAAALQSMETAVIGPLLGWLVDRFGPGIMIRIGVVLFALGLVILSQIDTLTGFYVAALIIAAGVSLCGYFPINVAIIHWFERKRARAMATSSLGLALGGLIVPLVAGSIAAFGRRATALGSAAAAFPIGWPPARVVRGKALRMGQPLGGAAPKTPPPKHQAPPHVRAHARPPRPPPRAATSPRPSRASPGRSTRGPTRATSWTVAPRTEPVTRPDPSVGRSGWSTTPGSRRPQP